MYLNDFSVRIEGKSESSGYIEMNHGEHYSLVLKNNGKNPCDATVEIDGKDVGAFRIESKQNIHLERPSNEKKLFTFYQLGTEEAEESGLNKVEKSDMGLIKVIFRPGEYKNQPLKTVEWCSVVGTNPFKRSRCSGFDQVSDMHDSSYYAGSTNQNSSGNLYRSCISADTNSKSYGSAAPNAGGTGLSGHSHQEFFRVEELNYDESRTTEIYLRLIPVKEKREKPTELKPVVKSTPIPPPLFIV